jgi:Tfp pilus assembly PilM family ATPase/Tfp pilus assembly protein PilN
MMKVTTLNIGLNSVRYMVFRDASAVKWGTLPLDGAVKNGLIQDPAAIGGQLKSLFASGKLPREKIICSISGMPFSYRLFTLPRMDTPSVNEAIARLARQEMPLSVEDMYLSWRAYPADKDEWQFLVAGVTRRPVDALIKTASVAGIKPCLMYLPHISLAALTRRENAIIVDFEPDYSNITLVVRGVPVGMHTVPPPGPEASLQDMTGQLIRELKRMTGFYNDNHPRSPIPETTPILLTGQLAPEPDTVPRLKEETGFPVEMLNEIPADTVVIPAEVPLATFAVNIGDALQDGIPRGHPSAEPALVRDINLQQIIDEQTGVKKGGGLSRKTLLAAALVIGVGALAFAYLSQNQAGTETARLQSELQQAKQELARLEQASALAGETEANINAIISSTRLLEQQNQRIFNPRDSVSDLKSLTQAMPPGTTFNTLDVSSGQISVAGVTASPEQVVAYVRSLEASGKFSAANIIWIDKAQNAGSTAISFLITIIR